MTSWLYGEKSFHVRGIVSYCKILNDEKMRIAVLLDEENLKIIQPEIDFHLSKNARSQHTLVEIEKICNEKTLEYLKDHPSLTHTFSFVVKKDIKSKDLSGNDFDIFNIKNGDEVFINCKSASGVVINPETAQKVGHRIMVFVNDLTLVTVEKLNLPYRHKGDHAENEEYLLKVKAIKENQLVSNEDIPF